MRSSWSSFENLRRGEKGANLQTFSLDGLGISTTDPVEEVRESYPLELLDELLGISTGSSSTTLSARTHVGVLGQAASMPQKSRGRRVRFL